MFAIFNPQKMQFCWTLWDRLCISRDLGFYPESCPLNFTTLPLCRIWGSIEAEPQIWQSNTKVTPNPAKWPYPQKWQNLVAKKVNMRPNKKIVPESIWPWTTKYSKAMCKAHSAFLVTKSSLRPRLEHPLDMGSFTITIQMKVWFQSYEIHALSNLISYACASRVVWYAC